MILAQENISVIISFLFFQYTLGYEVLKGQAIQTIRKVT